MPPEELLYLPPQDLPAVVELADGRVLWPVARAGRFVGKTGPVELTEALLAQLAQDYHPVFDEAAINVDHVKAGDNAGVVRALEMAAGILYAEPALLPPSIVERIDQGRLRRLSAEIQKQNPLTGRPYFKGLALLGAKDPAVTGLPPINLVPTTLEGVQNMPLIGRLFGGKNPTAPAPNPAGAPTQAGDPVQTTAQAAAPGTEETPAWAELSLAGSPGGGGEGPAQPTALLTGHLAAQNATLEAQLSRHRQLTADLEEQTARHQVRQDLAKLGTRISPALLKRGLEDLCTLLAQDAEPVIELAGGDGRPVQHTAYAVLLSLLEALPPRDSLLAGPLAGEDPGGPEGGGGAGGVAGDPRTAEERRIGEALGLTEARVAELAARYDMWGAS